MNTIILTSQQLHDLSQFFNYYEKITIENKETIVATSNETFPDGRPRKIYLTKYGWMWEEYYNRL